MIASEAPVPSEMAAVHVVVTRDGATKLDETLSNGIPGTLTLADANHGEGGSPVLVRVAGLGADGKERVTREARLGFVKQKTKLLRLRLERACENVRCVEGVTTCEGGMCVPIDVDPASLPDFDSNERAIAGESSAGAGGSNAKGGAAGQGGMGGHSGAGAVAGAGAMAGAGAQAGMGGKAGTGGAAGGIGKGGSAGQSGTGGQGGLSGSGGMAGAGAKAGSSGKAGAGGSAGSGGAAGIGGMAGSGIAGSGGMAGSGGAGGSAGSSGAAGAGCPVEVPLGAMSGKTFTPTGSLAMSRAAGFAEWLPTVGRVLLAGGYVVGGTLSATFELYDPVSGTWSSASGPYFQNEYHAMLADGRLIAGSGYANAPKLFDPASSLWTDLPPQLADHTDGSAIALNDGRVLVVGGSTASETFDPVMGKWKLALPMSHARKTAALVKLADGRVIAAGGDFQATPVVCGSDTEIFDPVFDTWSPGPATLTQYSSVYAASLPNGDALFFGGEGCLGETFDSAEILKGGATGAFVTGPKMAVVTDTFRITTLASGNVLVVGGYDFTTILSNASAQVFDPTQNAGIGAWINVGPMLAERYGGHVAALPDGRAVVAGGEILTPSCGTYEASTEIYTPLRRNAASSVGIGLGQASSTDERAVALDDDVVIVLHWSIPRGRCARSRASG